ncbi:biosynthetic-type acetolactate synthase large subunit [Selenomonas sp. TAMA-11512]|uniref:biosynthetic-type acetolactate synthase large subunit n=1 Tax=Selenomonas sp. TAMA-11512 TaxID=3095337 RepID=UPI0030871A82|nr:biosynthetic-type acetolactate synthase large subunit [Selenomonas sp. TAMA-11512]
MKKNGAEIVLESLRQEGVSVVFGYPGGAVLDLYDAIYKEKFPHVLVRHEQGAAHAADGYARATGKVGVCIATSGPGATNLVTGIATANMDSIPLVCITGQVGTPLIGKDSFQEADMVGITTPITKHNYLVKDVEDLPRVLKEAFFIARTGRPGPVVIDIAKTVFTQVLEYTYPDAVELKGYTGENLVKGSDVEAAAEAISAAKRPLFIIGGGVTLANQAEVMRQILDVTGIPVTTTLMGIGCVPAGREDFLGMAGMHGSYAANMAISECDLLIAVGMRFDDRVTSRTDAFAPRAKIVHFEIDPAELGKNIPVDIPVLGDIRWSLPLFLEKLRASDRDYRARFAAWNIYTREMINEHPLAYQEREGLIMPQAIVEAVGACMDDDTVIVTDVGQHQMWAAQFYPAVRPRHFLTSGGLGTMGYGLPAAVGAKVGEPAKKVVLITGDGSFMMNCQELATVADNDIDIKIVIVHNRVLGMVAQWQKLFYERHFSYTLLSTRTDFVALAKAMGVDALKIDNADTWKAELKEALAADGARLIDIWTPSNVDVVPMVPGGKRLDEMVLEEVKD